MKHKLLDIAILFFIASLGVFFFYLIKNNQILKEKIASQEFKASALISEVGQTRDESNLLYQKLQDYKIKMETLEREVGLLKQSSQASILTYEALPLIDISNDFSKKVPRPSNSEIMTEQSYGDELNARHFLIVGHNGHLADTIILAAADLPSRKINLINIPRDLFVNGRKINEYLSLYGVDTLVSEVETVTGVKLDGYITFNFRAFENVIDALGGIEIYVDKAIYDSAYPDGKGGYITYSVQTGATDMNGVEALKYARSRHSTSDFDRSRRQQQIIEAVKEKILTLGLLGNLAEIQKIFDVLKNDIETNISLYDAVSYMLQLKDFKIETGNIISTANLFYSTTNISGQYILLPRSGDFREIKEYVRRKGQK